MANEDLKIKSINQTEINTLKRQECQIFSRVTGWLVPRHMMNPGKVAEFNDRKWYSNKIATKDL